MKAQNIDSLLCKALAAEDFDPAVHARILKELKRAEPAGLSLKTRFHATDYLQRATVFLAKANDYKTPCPFNSNDFVVDESMLPDEVEQLLTINDTLQYSDALMAHFDKGRQAFISSLASSPVFAGISWDDASRDEKLERLHQFIQRSIDIHSPYKTQTILSCQCAPDSEKGLYAYASQVAGHKNGRYYNKATINFSADLLDNPSAALRLAYHESIHVVMQEIGLALENGEIHADDPLYEDARIKLAHMESGQRSLPLIHSFYINENEERVAYGEQQRFEDSLMARAPA